MSDRINFDFNRQDSKHWFRKVTGLFLVINLWICLAACRPEVPPSTATPASVPSETSTAPASPPSEIPAATLRPNRVILLAPPGSDPRQQSALQKVTQDLSSRESLSLEVKDLLTEADFDASLKLVVALPPDAGLSRQAAAHPEVKFLGVAIPGLVPAANLSVINPQGDRPDRQGFLAGYLAAVITRDWRVGVISRADSPAGQAARAGFMNGVVFFCGLCRPAFPPFHQYPVYAELPAAADQDLQQSIVDIMVGNAVATVYVPAEASEQTILVSLAEKGLNIIGADSPDSRLRERWVATVRADLAVALKQAWSDLLQGKPGAAYDMPILLEDVNESLFSPGRQNLVEKIAAELQADAIDTGVDPLTGALK